MKKIIYSVLAFFIFYSTINAQCPNGNAESNSFVNWKTYFGPAQNPQNLNFVAPITSSDITRFGTHNSSSNYWPVPGAPEMLQNGEDLFGNFLVPDEGNYCFSLGNDGTGAEMQAMKYTFTVTNQNKKFKFRYALVLQDGGHPAGNNPAAWFYVIKGSNSGISPSFSNASDINLYLTSMRQKVADLTNPFYSQSNRLGFEDVIYKNWQCEEIDLSAYVGQTVSFVAMVRDCTETGHFGYLYLDGLCQEKPTEIEMTLNEYEICDGQDIIMSAYAQDEDSYNLTIAETVPGGGLVPGGLFFEHWYIAQQAPTTLNIMDFAEANGIQFECGKEYLVRLAISNPCHQWNEVIRRFKLKCETLGLSQTIATCCSQPAQSYVIGDLSNQQNKYTWTSIPSGFHAETNVITVKPYENTVYFLTSLLENGCIARDTFLFIRKPDKYNVSISKKYNLCDPAPILSAKLTFVGCPTPKPEFNNFFLTDTYANIHWYFKYQGTSTWQLIGTGESIQAPNADGDIEARIESECMTGIVSVAALNIPYRPMGHGLLAPDYFTADNNGFNDVFRIMEVGPFAPQYIGDEPAYGIIDFKLEFINRWGQIFKTVTKADAGRLPNENVRQGDIFWDGTDDNGVQQQDGLYNYRLSLKYCGTDEFQTVCMDGAQVNPCIQWTWLFCTHHLDGCISSVFLFH